MNQDDAIRSLRTDPSFADLVRDSYLGRDVSESAMRFSKSGEFAAVLKLLGTVKGTRVIDIGAGTGIASFAFRVNGAQQVFALEPDPSSEVGCGAMTRLPSLDGISILAGIGEAIPLADNSVDIAYCRQVLHHVRDLDTFFSEVHRILRPGGLFLACREHVVDDDAQLRSFLQSHAVHQLSGGENAYPLQTYLRAIEKCGLKIKRLFGPWDSVVNAYPSVRSEEERIIYPRTVLIHRLGPLGHVVSRIPGVDKLIWKRLNRPLPGRMYSFLAVAHE